VKIYNRPLTATEIFSEYYASQTGLVAFYPFNGNANDASGNLNHGVVNGAVLTADRYGVADRAYYFDGGNTYIEGVNPGNKLPVGSQPRTISCWVQSAEVNGDRNIFHYGTKGIAPTNYHLYLNQGTHIGVGNGYGYGTLISNTEIGDNTWYFVTGVYEGETTNFQKVYINGKLDASSLISTTPNTVLSSNWKMGEFMEATQSLMGKIDDLRVFTIALSDEDILNQYLSETTSPVLQQPANHATVTTLTPTMQWSSTFTDAEFRFQLSADSLFGLTLFDDVTTGLSAQLPGGLIAAGQKYYWRVRTTLNGETGPWSDVWNFSYTNTGINKHPSTSPALTVMPNPSNSASKVIYTVPSAGTSIVPVTIEIINSVGKITDMLVNTHLVPGKYEFQLNTEVMEAGIYFVRLKTGNTITVRKLVIIH
jgi:hypothetical protein